MPTAPRPADELFAIARLLDPTRLAALISEAERLRREQRKQQP